MCAEDKTRQLWQALGLLTTLKPSMIIRTEDPVGMAREIAAYIQGERQAYRENWSQMYYTVQDTLSRHNPENSLRGL